MQIFAGVRWRGGVKWECGSWKWRFSLHSFTFFRTFYIHGHTTAFRWYDCQWPWAYFKVTGLFHIEFLKNGVWYGKSYYRQLIGNCTLAFDWSYFRWPWSTFEGHFSLGCHFHVHFSNPWHAFASHGLPAIAELLVVIALWFYSMCSCVLSAAYGVIINDRPMCPRTSWLSDTTATASKQTETTCTAKETIACSILYCACFCLVKGAGIVITLVAVLINVIIGYLQ